MSTVRLDFERTIGLGLGLDGLAQAAASLDAVSLTPAPQQSRVAYEPFSQSGWLSLS